MRRFMITLLLLLVFAGVLPFVFPWGKPMLSWEKVMDEGISSISIPDIPELSSLTLPWQEEKARTVGEPITLYRWEDADGTPQYSNEPPVGVSYERVKVQPDANLIQAIKTESAHARKEAETGVSEAPKNGLSPLTVSPEETMQLLEDTQRLREVSEERLRQHEALIR